jgi:MFS transporter, DHA3 family, tetracycline resistance protein
VPVYYFLSGGYAFFFIVFVSVNLVWQTQEAGLNPLQLVLIGTILEATIFFCEIPTGLVADVYSRRASVVVGFVLMGVGIMVSGIVPAFWIIVVGHVVWGFGYTFISGAKQAWIADEIGVENVGRVYLRTAQIDLFARLAGLPVGVAIGLSQLNLPILVGGASFVGMGFLLIFLMSETGFRPRARGDRSPFSAMTQTFGSGISLVRRRPLLLTIFGIAAFYGMASEGFDRLWIKHFFDNVGFPTFIEQVRLPVGLPAVELEPVVWVNVVRMGSMLLSIGVVEIVRRRVDTNSHRAVALGLMTVNLLQVASLFFFAFAADFGVAMAAFWGATILSRIYDPLYLAWINQNIESGVRATVISMSSQADAFGQISGGPVLGVVGTLAGVRAALVGAALVLAPAMPLYARALRQGPPSPEPAVRESAATET